jgi:hypothetical protein
VDPILTSTEWRRGRCGGVGGQAGTGAREADRGACLSRGSQAQTRRSQWTHHAPAQRLSSPGAWQAQTPAPTAREAQGQEGQCSAAAVSRWDDHADQCATRVARWAGCPGVAALSLADRTAVETWNQHGKLDTWRSYKPQRILTELYAKLLGLLITHWEVVVGCWQAPNRSLLKAKQVVQWMTR